MDDRVARLHHRQEQGGDRRHAGGEGERILRLLPDGEAVLQYLLVRPVEARIDEALRAAGALAGDALEMALARRRAGKDEGGGEEDRRLQRAFRQRRVIAVAHHQRGGAELAPADPLDLRPGRTALPGRLGAGFGILGHRDLRTIGRACPRGRRRGLQCRISCRKISAPDRGRNDPMSSFRCRCAPSCRPSARYRPDTIAWNIASSPAHRRAPRPRSRRPSR